MWFLRKAQETADWNSTAHQNRRAACEEHKKKKTKERDKEGTTIDARPKKQNFS